MKFSDFFKNYLLLAIYIMANAMFVLKYGVRQDVMPVTLLIALYVIGSVATDVIVSKLGPFFNRWKAFNSVFLILGISVTILFILLNLYVDPESLNVLRYKGLNTTISHVLQGDYPYSTFLDAKGDTTSNLPGLFYLGLPFYFLGDVGYLQVFMFLSLFYLLFQSKLLNSEKIWLLLMLLLSPAFLWEVAVKSDMLSNLFLLSFFMFWWTQKYSKNYFQNPWLLGFLVAFFTLTRLIVIIPFLLMFFYPFLRATFSNQLKFIASLVVSVILIASPILMTIPSWEVFIEFNPLNNQTGEAPWYVSLVFFLSAMALSKTSHTRSTVFMTSSLLVFAVVLIRFLLNGFEEGFYRNIFENLFDISYFGLVIPFLFFYFLSRKNIMHA